MLASGIDGLLQAVATTGCNQMFVRVVQTVAEALQILQGLLFGKLGRIELPVVRPWAGKRDQALSFICVTHREHRQMTLWQLRTEADKNCSINLDRLLQSIAVSHVTQCILLDSGVSNTADSVGIVLPALEPLVQVRSHALQLRRRAISPQAF